MIKKLHNFKGIQYPNIFILLMMLVGSVNFAATNDEFTVTEITACNAGADNTGTEFCLAEAKKKFPSINDARAFYLSLLESDVSKNGTFNPSISVIARNFKNNPIGTFQTTYTVTEGNCSDSAKLAVTVFPNPNAGSDNINNVFCFNDINSTLSNEQSATNYFRSLLGPNADSKGIFSPSINEIVTEFNINPARVFSTTYTVTNANCSDTANLSVSIIPESYAGKDNTSTILTRSQANKIFTGIDGATNYYLNLLGPGAYRKGNFNPEIVTLARRYRNNQIGTFSTTYTVSNAGCMDTAEVSVTIVEDSKAQASASKSQASSLNSSSSLVIYNLSGNVVKSSKVNAIEMYNSNSSDFSDSNLKKGIYIYKLNDGNGVISTKKIIVE